MQMVTLERMCMCTSSSVLTVLETCRPAAKKKKKKKEQKKRAGEAFMFTENNTD